MGLLIRNIMEKIIKIATFSHIGILTPLYEENFTIVESNTITVVKIKTKISEFFLDRFTVTRLAIFSFIMTCKIHKKYPV